MSSAVRVASPITTGHALNAARALFLKCVFSQEAKQSDTHLCALLRSMGQEGLSASASSLLEKVHPAAPRNAYLSFLEPIARLPPNRVHLKSVMTRYMNDIRQSPVLLDSQIVSTVIQVLTNHICIADGLSSILGDVILDDIRRVSPVESASPEFIVCLANTLDAIALSVRQRSTSKEDGLSVELSRVRDKAWSECLPYLLSTRGSQLAASLINLLSSSPGESQRILYVMNLKGVSGSMGLAVPILRYLELRHCRFTEISKGSTDALDAAWRVLARFGITRKSLECNTSTSSTSADETGRIVKSLVRIAVQHSPSIMVSISILDAIGPKDVHKVGSDLIGCIITRAAREGGSASMSVWTYFFAKYVSKWSRDEANRAGQILLCGIRIVTENQDITGAVALVGFATRHDLTLSCEQRSQLRSITAPDQGSIFKKRLLCEMLASE